MTKKKWITQNLLFTAIGIGIAVISIGLMAIMSAVEMSLVENATIVDLTVVIKSILICVGCMLLFANLNLFMDYQAEKQEIAKKQKESASRAAWRWAHMTKYHVKVGNKDETI